jgi:hypothetical protein
MQLRRKLSITTSSITINSSPPKAIGTRPYNFNMITANNKTMVIVFAKNASKAKAKEWEKKHEGGEGKHKKKKKL